MGYSDELDEFDPATLVLVVEEDDEERATLCEGLSREGYRVVAVEDGLELFDYLDLVQATAGRVKMPDVIVSDVELSGCGGVTACRELHHQHPETPVVLLSPSLDSRTWVAAERAGAADVLKRPVDLRELREALALLV